MRAVLLALIISGCAPHSRTIHRDFLCHKQSCSVINPWTVGN